MDFIFYENDNGSPGETVVATITDVVPYAQVPIGSADGFNIFSVMIEVDLEFEGGADGTGFWMQPVANASETLYWGTTTTGTLGEPIHTKREDNPWSPDPDGEQAVFKLYCDVAMPPDPVCMFDIAVDVLPITRISFAGIDNTSSPEVNGTPYLEDFTHIEGIVEPGETYTFILEGNTNGNYTHFSSVWIDWNQNGEYDEEEIYVVGPLSDSSGTDGKQATIDIEVPADAELGTTTFRVAKIWDVIPYNPCGSYLFGQGEDYSLIVEESLGTHQPVKLHTSLHPNPAEDKITLNSTQKIEEISIHTALGQPVLTRTYTSDEIDISMLSGGIYFISLKLENGNSKTIKIVKK